MSYVEPTATTFKARYPEFTPVDDALVSLVLGESISEVGETWYENDRARAQMLLTAHNLSMEGEPLRSQAAEDGAIYDPSAGAMKRRKVGDVEVEFQNANEQFGSSAGQERSGVGYENSHYGRQYKELLRKNFPAVLVV